MQGQRSSISTLPENLSFDHGSTAGDTLDSPMPWNSIHASPQTRIPDYRMSSSEPSIQYLQQVTQNANWSLGESSSSSSQNQAEQNETKAEHPWNFRSQPTFGFSERHYERPIDVRSINVDLNANDNQTANGMFVLPNSCSVALPQDLNMSYGFGNDDDDDDDDDDCQVVECPSSYTSSGSSSEQRPFTGLTSDSVGVSSRFVVEGSEDRLGCSGDCRRISCKRKSLDVHVGQSSGAGSSRNAERKQWHDISDARDFRISTQTENEVVINNGLELANPRIRLGVGGAVSASPFSLTSAINAESSRRNLRLRINGLHQQEVMPANLFPEVDAGNADVSSNQHLSRLVLQDHLFNLNPPPIVESSVSQGPPVLLHVPSVCRNPTSRWNGASSSRTGSSSASAIPGERGAPLFEEPSARNIPRRISEHPMFVSANEVGSSSQHPTNWNLAGGNIAGNIASSSSVGSSSGVNPSTPTWSHRSCPQYPRRLSEIVRRSLLSAAGTEPGGSSSNQVIQASSSTVSQEMALSLGSEAANSHRRTPSSRLAFLERHLDGTFGIPHSLRTLAAAGEGRSSIMSEIRHVLDLMRRGEGLRFESVLAEAIRALFGCLNEFKPQSQFHLTGKLIFDKDMMILDHSVLFGMADVHDRHQDMRLDVDNMSYEELLALEERIGNVCTGLSEETIMSRLKQHKHVGNRTEDEGDPEPCSICREEYVHGEDLGKLECGHDFHRDCIRQWLMHKNSCPICKTTGLTTT